MTAKKKTQKVQFIPAADLAKQMELTIRDHAPKNGGEPNPSLMVLRTPGTSEEDKALLMDFIKRTGLTVVRSGKASIRYKQGNCHWLCFVKRSDFARAKAKMVPPPVAEEEYSEDESDASDSGDAPMPPSYSRPAPPSEKDMELKRGLSQAAALASQLAQVLAKLAG